MSFLEGKKTYLGVIALFILGGFNALGLIDKNTYDTLFPIIIGWTGFGLRQAMK